MEIQLEPCSVTKIVGSCKEALVFGFFDCHYSQVAYALPRLHISSTNYSMIKFNLIDYDTADVPNNVIMVVSRRCKAIITSLIIENYKRTKEGRTMIPLIFCVGKEEQSSTVKLDIEKVSQSHNSARNTTDDELRRCYKIYAQMNAEIQQIASKTFKFVKLKQDKTNSQLYSLEQVEPFWQDPRWEKAWEARMACKKTPSLQKKYQWRVQLSTEIANINRQQLFFKLATGSSDHLLTKVYKKVEEGLKYFF